MTSLTWHADEPEAASASRPGASATSPAPSRERALKAADERRLSGVVARYGRLDLLCLDELGYVQPRGGDPRSPRWPAK